MALCKRKGCLNDARLNVYKGHDPLYCSKKCKNIDHVFLYRKRKKLELINLLGGKCCRCGYNKCMSALEFHHLDPAQKDFSLSSGLNSNFKKVLEEIKKCILLCANCHREAR
jgi:hypothetical protein